MPFDLQDRAFHPRERVPPLVPSQLLPLVADQFEQPIAALEDAVLELTARHPCDLPTGLMNVYVPARWDSTANWVVMDGVAPGGESGTRAWVEFQAPAATTYLVAVSFVGIQMTMRLLGPWGINTAHTETASEVVTAVALWTAAAAGRNLQFTMNCFSDGADSGGVALLHSVQVFPVG
jgi:hypothetical protein